jgi:hypothetical protein
MATPEATAGVTPRSVPARATLGQLRAAVVALCVCGTAAAQTAPAAPANPRAAASASPLANAAPVFNLRRAAPAAAPARLLSWGELIAPGWEGLKQTRAADLQSLSDNDPRAAEILKQMRQTLDNAPVNLAWVNQPVRIAGYVVPLEQGKDGLTEFLLVPYHGACIHTPPPPSNQIIHVVSRQRPVQGVQTMDTVVVSGVLGFARNDSGMGVSSWRLPADSVAPYTDSFMLPNGARAVR